MERDRGIRRYLMAFPAAAVVLSLALGAHARAAILPTGGTFRGIYHENRAGVGKFEFFLIPAALKPQMAPYEGKYIELEVVKARQPMNPGPAIVEQLGRIVELPAPPLRIELHPIAPGINGGQTFDVIYSFRNVSDTDVVLKAGDIQIGVLGYPTPAEPEEPDTWFGTGYTRRQLGFGGGMVQPWNFISPMEPGRATAYYTGYVLVRPGEAAPFVWHGVTLGHGVALAPGRYELVASARLPGAADQSVPVRASMPLDLPLAGPRAEQRHVLKAETRVTRDVEWFVVDGRLLPDADGAVHIFTRPDGDRHFLPGLFQFWSREGTLLGFQLDWNGLQGPWRRVEVGADGLSFRFRVRHTDLFSTDAPARITMWTVTDNGIEKLVLAEALPESGAVEMPPWGEEVRGCRLRVRMPKTEFAAGEAVRFFFQAESDGKKADILWMDKGHFTSHVVAAIDGRQARIATTMISDEHVNAFPFQGEIVLSTLQPVAPGRHALRLSVTGDSGTYTNLAGKKFRKFRGILVSNTVEFEVGR